MVKRNHQRKKSTNMSEKVEETQLEVVNFDKMKVEGKVCNVFEQEMCYKIQNYRVDKAYSVSFLLPRSIECTLGLYPIAKTIWNNENDAKKHQREPHRIVVVKPILFFNKIPNKREHYKFKLKIQPVVTGNARYGFGMVNYENASTRPEGFSGFGQLITSKNVRNFLDHNSQLVLNLSFTLKEVEHCKPFDRQDYTIERSAVAKDMTKLLMSENFADVTIIIGDDKIPAHKVILAAHSKVLAKMIEESQANEIVIAKKAPKEAYIELIRFIYNATIKRLKENLEPLLMLAKEFEIEELRMLCLMEIDRAINAKYTKFIGKNPKLPESIMNDDNKAIKFYRLLYDMDELIYDKNNDGPTPSSSKSSLDEEEEELPQGNQPYEPEASQQDIQLPTIVLHPPPAFEPLISEEIFTNSLTDLFVNTLSPIQEQEELTSGNADVIVEKVEVIYTASDSTKDAHAEINECTMIENSTEIEIKVPKENFAKDIECLKNVDENITLETVRESSDNISESDEAKVDTVNDPDDIKTICESPVEIENSGNNKEITQTSTDKESNVADTNTNEEN